MNYPYQQKSTKSERLIHQNKILNQNLQNGAGNIHIGQIFQHNGVNQVPSNYDDHHLATSGKYHIQNNASADAKYQQRPN